MMKQRLLLRLVLMATVFTTGNLFWRLFAQVLSVEPLLTSSPLRVAFYFIYPILAMSAFLASLAFLSRLIKNFWLLFAVCISSSISYLNVLGLNTYSLAGIMVISASLTGFLFSYGHIQVQFNHRPNIFGRLSLALSTPTLLISVVVAFNFYNFYNRTLAASNIVLSDRVITQTLSPIVRLYADDLGLKNLNETFASYLDRQTSDSAHKEQLERRVLNKLNLSQASSSATMGKLIDESLKTSVLKIAADYRRKLPLLVSLGLGIITQTVLTLSSLLSGLWLYLVVRLLD